MAIFINTNKRINRGDTKNMENITTATHFISNLSSTGLMALIIVILGLVVKNFYEKSEREHKKLLEKIFSSIKDIDSRLEETNNNQKTANLIAESQKNLIEKNYQLQNSRVNSAVDESSYALDKIQKEVNSVGTKVEFVKKDTDLLKKAAHLGLQKSNTIINLYKNDGK